MTVSPRRRGPAKGQGFHVVAEITKIATRKGERRCLVSWKGHDKPTWEPYAVMAKDVPDLVRSAEESIARVAGPKEVAVDAADNDYERERELRIQANKAKLSMLGVLHQQKTLMDQWQAKQVKRAVASPVEIGVQGSAQKRKKHARRPARPVTRQRSREIRTSPRLRGSSPEFASGLQVTEREEAEYEQEGRLVLDDDVSGDGKDEAKVQRLLAQRCNSKGRGSVYDSKVGITCHFCRQKKLCGEPGCPRCSTRQVSRECIGKSDCSRCGSATGKFCRACLLIRYGLVLEDVRREMEQGTWLCAHCYEEEHPDEGWICNSSFCMSRRGLAPTGIAIYDAQKRGFPSVAHYVQAKLNKHKRNKGEVCQAG